METGITFVVMIEEEDEVAVDVDVDVDVMDIIDNRLIKWRMEVTIMKAFSNVTVARDIVEGAMDLHLIGQFKQRFKELAIFKNNQNSVGPVGCNSCFVFSFFFVIYIGCSYFLYC